MANKFLHIPTYGASLWSLRLPHPMNKGSQGAIRVWKTDYSWAAKVFSISSYGLHKAAGQQVSMKYTSYIYGLQNGMGHDSVTKVLQSSRRPFTWKWPDLSKWWWFGCWIFPILILYLWLTQHLQRNARKKHKYNVDIGQIQQPNHHNFDKTGHFQINLQGNGLLEQIRTLVIDSKPIPLCRSWIYFVYFNEKKKTLADPEGLQNRSEMHHLSSQKLHKHAFQTYL